MLCQINNHLATALYQLEKSHRIYMVAFNIAAKYNDHNSVLIVMNNIVRTWIELKKPASAVAFMKSIPESFSNLKTKDKGAILRIANKKNCQASYFY
jgi:hypothetical protein